MKNGNKSGVFLFQIEWLPIILIIKIISNHLLIKERVWKYQKLIGSIDNKIKEILTNKNEFSGK